jgi:hypothetical protein
MTLRSARLVGAITVLALGLAGCGGRATPPGDGGPEDAGGRDGSGRCVPGWSGCETGAVCDVRGCADNTAGTCVWKESTCPELYAPVCGCDGLSYDNDCLRLQSGADWHHDGQCQVDGGQGCLDADLEPNDTAPTATGLDPILAGHPQGVSLYGLQICTAGDRDYYSFTVAVQKNATVIVQYARAAGELNATLLDPSLATIAQGAPVAGGLQLTATLGPQSGSYYVLVQAGPGGTTNSYDLSLSLQ